MAGKNMAERESSLLGQQTSKNLPLSDHGLFYKLNARVAFWKSWITRRIRLQGKHAANWTGAICENLLFSLREVRYRKKKFGGGQIATAIFKSLFYLNL